MNAINILSGGWQNLLEVKRWGTTNMSNHLSVAEHSWLTAMLSERFIREAIRRRYLFRSTVEVMVDISRTATINALIHDLEECLISDIPNTSFTRDNPHVISLKKDAIESVGAYLFDDPYDNLGYVFDRRNAKEGVAGQVVSYADAYSMLIELNRQTGYSEEYQEIAYEILEGLESVADPIQDIVDEYVNTPLGHFHDGMSVFFADLTSETKAIYQDNQLLQNAPPVVR